MTSKLKNWAKRKGPRWITQQSFQALTACLLTVMAATHGHTSDLFLYGAMATITGDSLCLWTGTPEDALRARAATVAKIEQIETRFGMPLPECRVVYTSYAYNRARNRGQDPALAWALIQIFVVVPVALHTAHISLGFLAVLLGRELICRFGPFAVPTAEAAAAIAAHTLETPDQLIPEDLLSWLTALEAADAHATERPGSLVNST